MSGWGSPFKLDGLVGAVSKTLQNLDRSIDKAIGIEPENNNPNNTNSLSNSNSPRNNEDTTIQSSKRFPEVLWLVYSPSSL